MRATPRGMVHFFKIMWFLFPIIGNYATFLVCASFRTFQWLILRATPLRLRPAAIDP